MGCFSPIKAYRSKFVNENGKRPLVFNPHDAWEAGFPLEISCGQCAGCRKEYVKSWALRCCAEAEMQEKNCFITLTYRTEALPPLGSCRYSEFQKFMKRLRKKIGALRFYACQEYGGRHNRPHYHAILFGVDFPDKELKFIRSGKRYYTSRLLEKAWPHGHCLITEVNYQTAAYVASYMKKKWKGKNSESKYEVVDTVSGEIIGKREPEKANMSRRPGIGRSWFEKYKTDVFPKDFVVFYERKFRPPKYFCKLLEESDPQLMKKIVDKRREHLQSKGADYTPERLRAKEKLAKIKQKQYEEKVKYEGIFNL